MDRKSSGGSRKKKVTGSASGGGVFKRGTGVSPAPLVINRSVTLAAIAIENRVELLLVAGRTCPDRPEAKSHPVADFLFLPLTAGLAL